MSQFAHNFWRIFSAHAETIPNVEAILAPGRKALRFGEFARHLLAVKETLNSYGIGRGDRVASALPRGSETAVCAVAATACSTYIPLNPDLTEEEFSRYLSRIRPKAVIVPAGSGEAARQAANLHGIMIIELLPDAKGPAGSFTLEQGTAGLCHLPQWNRADDIAFILPTSGTTSEQKLIPTKQHHMLALSQAAQKHFNLGPSDRCLHIMPMFHGHGLESSLLVPLIIGSGVICPEVFDIPSFFDCVKQFEPTWYSAGYSHHGAILNQIDDYRTIANNSTFRFIRSGSGRLDPRVNLGLEDAFGAPVIERYGMSEATSLTANPLPPAIRKPGTVGLPLTGEIRIVDETGATLGANCDGEKCYHPASGLPNATGGIERNASSQRP